MANQLNNQVKIFNTDGSVEEVDQSEFQPIPEASAIRSIGDTLLKFGRGATSATKAGIDQFGANNKVSRGLKTATDFLSSGLSDEAVMNDQIAAKRLEDTQDAGTLEQLKAVGKNFIENPIDTLAEGAGSIVPTAAAMIASKGRINPATTGAVMGVGQGMGAVKGSIYDATKAEALKLGYSEQDAENLAQNAQAYTGENKDQIALGGALGYLAGKTGAESSSILTGQAKNSATDLLRGTLKGFGTEAVTEGLQGGQEKVAANLALQRLGADVPIDRGVAGQAASEAIAGGLTGGAFGAADALMAEPTNPREQLRNTLLAQNPNGAITQAAATAAATGAADGAITGFDGRLSGVAETLDDRKSFESLRNSGADAGYINSLVTNYNIARNPENIQSLREQALSNVERLMQAPSFTMVGDADVQSPKAKKREVTGQYPTIYQGGQNDGDFTKQQTTDMVTGSSGLEPANDAGSAGNTISQPSDTTADSDTTETTTQGFGSDISTGNADANENVAVSEPTGNSTSNSTSTSTGNSTGNLKDTNETPAVDVKANEAATSPQNDLPQPTQAQLDAGNYKVGRIKVGGLDISVENPDQSTRSGVDPDGNAWESTMNGHYGYVKGVKARSPDKEHVDVNVKPSTAEDFAGDVYVVNQNNPATGEFDEPKVYVGYDSAQEAEQAYRSNYADDWQGFGSITQVPMAKFKEMLNDEQAFMKPVKPTLREQIAEKQSREGARPLIESIVKRRAVANEINKSKPFDTYLQMAKDFLNGADIKASRFKLASLSFKDDSPLSEAYAKLAELAGEPDKEIKKQKNEFIATVKQQIGEAKTADELNALRATVKGNKTLSDTQYVELDDAITEAIVGIGSNKTSNQFNNYRIWIEKGNDVSKGMIEIIKKDERLNDGEADKLIAMVQKENTEEKKAEGLISETGSQITSPLYVGLYNKGYKMLRLDEDKTYSDKGNARYRTFEKDGVRIALTGQQVMFEHKGNALYGQGENNDVVVQFIGVDPDKRKQGRANKALKEIADIADEKSLNVYIEPTSLDKSAMSKEQLAELYKKFGFNWAGESKKIMVRKPNQQNKTNELVNSAPQQRITKEETEDLFGLKTKREKALKRIAEGRGWFGAQDKAKEFVRINGLSDTHEVIKGSGMRWEIVEKQAAPNLGNKKTGDILNIDGDMYRIEGASDRAGNIKLTKNPDMLSERTVHVDQNTFNNYVKRDDEYRAEIAGSNNNQSKNIIQQAKDMGKLEIITVTDKPKQFANNKIFTADKVEAARARLKSKLGNINSGIDPELLIDGMTIAGAYIESGVRSFSAYSKAMVADFGDSIKPYLLSFYEAARAYPNIDKEGMSSVDEAKNQYDALITPEVKKEIKQVIGNGIVKADKKPAKRNGESTLTQDWGVEHIDGWTDNKNGTGTNERENGITNGVKDQFLAETKKYLTQVAGFLQEAGFEPYKLKNGKDDKAVSVNESGVATSGDVTLSMRNGDVGVYVTIGASSVSYLSGGHPQRVAIMARAFNNADKNRWGGGQNNWLPTDLNATALADKVLSLADGFLKNNTTETQDYVKNQTTPTNNEVNNDARANKTEPVPDGNTQSDLLPEQSRSSDSEQVVSGVARNSERNAEQDPVSGSVFETSGTGTTSTSGISEPQSPSGSRETSNAGNQPSAANVDNFEITDDVGLGEGGLTKKYRDNVDAIKIIKALESEKRIATPEERIKLAKYVGFGALKGVFDRENKQWNKQYQELKELLTEDEYKAARASVLNAHYTAKSIVTSMYDAVNRLGFNGGRVLEPSLGSGNFFGLMPASIRNKSQLNGVELDVITSRLAKYLYPNANIATATGFETYQAPEGYFDLVIGNPPFGSERIFDTDKSPYSGFSIHNYFLAKSIDKLREGGVMAVVVSHNFMDVNNSPAREWIAKKANLIAAVRLPDDAFQENAGTEVVTDILLFQKTAKPEENPIWLQSKEIELENPKTGEKSKHFVNQYFSANPRNLLGRETAGGTMYRGDSYTVESTGNVANQLKEFVSRLPQNLYVEPAQRIEVLDKADNTVPDGVKVGTYYRDESGVIRQRLTDVMNNKRSMVWEAPNEGALNRMIAMMTLRDTLRTQMRLERDYQSSQVQIDTNRKALNRQYDDFLKRYGYLNSMTNRRLFMDDTESALLQALELDYDQGVSKAKALSTGLEEKPASAQKADIFNQRVLFPPSDVINVNNAKDALLASLNVKGMVDIDYMADVYNKPVADIVGELGDVLYNDPQKGYVTADEYLSGDVKTKLIEAISAAKQNDELKRNVTALEKVIPKDKLPSEIYASVGANWIPNNVYSDFASEITGIPADKIDFRYVSATAVWVNERAGSGDVGKMTSDFGTEKINAFDLLAMMMNGKSPEIKYTVKNPDGTTSTNTDIEATEAAREKYQKIKETWESWLFSDANRADKLATIYNDKHNRTVERKFDGSHMTFAGMTPVMNGKPFAGLRPHQKDVVWRAIQDRNVLLDHVVGAGKTMAMAATAMEMRRLGIARKPLFVVPNHLTLQWRSEFTKLYPASNILAATPDDFAKDKREAMFSKMVTGNYDAIIIGHSSLKKVGLPAEVEARMYDQQVEEIANAIEDIKRERGDRGIVRDMEKIKTTLENKIKDLKSKAGKKDDVVNFDELGIDALFVDEMHEFKNLFFTTQMQRTSGLGNPKGSGKAFDLFMKVKWMTETFGEDVPLITATGTPVSNSLAEMFTMQRYMKFNEMKRNDLHLFDAWAKQYGEVENVYEVAPSGVGYRQSTRFSKFKNLPSLMGSYTSFADIITLQDLKDQTAQQLDENGKPKKFPVPRLKTGKPINVIAKRSELQTNFFGVPQLAVDESGNIKFEIDLDKAGIEVMDNGKWRLSFEGGFSDFETREEAELELVSKALTPQTFLDPESLLGKFANLKQLTKETKGKVNALSLTGLANKAGLDFRIIDPFAPDFPDSKINQSVANMMQEYRTWTKDKGTQIVFCDMSIPNSARASMGSKEKRIYVRDNQRLITHKPKGTVYASEGYEGYPFYMVKEKNGFTIYEAVSGIEMPAYNIQDKAAAKAWIDNYVQNEAGRDKIFSVRDQYAIDQAQIDEYREEKELEVAEDGSNEITLEDLEAIAGSSQFSVYDDIKAKLIAQGVPESEIAFIHDYNTPKQKDMLFKQVNRGDVRFLFGSTPKLGAGTNVQQRLVALHHIDAPWRPSDLEQREGRGIRQGNLLYERDPDGFELGIYRYATEQTYDTRRWQLLEHKAAGVEQLRKYSGESEIEDIAGEAANSADMKAAASGNPLILEETKLRTEVKRLTNLQKAHADSKYSMARKIKDNERAISERWPNIIQTYQENIATVNQYPIPSDKEQIADIVVDGKRIKSKASAENDIGLLGTKVRQSYLINENRKIVYRGIEFSLERGVNLGEMKLNAPDGFMINYYGVKDNFSPSGLVTRLNNYIDSFGDRIEKFRNYIEQAIKENESLASRVDEPFELVDTLKQTQSRHAEVQRKLMKSTSLEAIPEGQRAEFNRILAERKEKLTELGYENALKEAETDDSIAFSRVESAPIFYSQLSRLVEQSKNKGLPIAEVQSIVNSIKSQWKSAPPIFVVENMQDEIIPARVREYDKKLKAQGSTGDPVAFISGGNVYVLSSMVKNQKEVYEALFHEVLGHYGLRGTFGGELNTILDQIALLRSKEVIAKAKKYGFDIESKADLRRAAEEVLAEMAQKRPEIGFVKRAIAAIRKFLRDIGFNIALTNSDIINNYLLPARRFVESGGNLAGIEALATAYKKTTAFSRANQTDSPEFKKWFGNSKVVDADGKPLVVYHGTGDTFSKFERVIRNAFFFSPDPNFAVHFAESRAFDIRENDGYNEDFYGKMESGGANVMPVYLSVQNPFNPRIKKHIDSLNLRNDYDAQRLSDGDFSTIEDYFDEIKKAGYDGFYEKEGEKREVWNIGVFNPNQIKSAIGNNGQFDAGNDDIMFMRTPQSVVSNMVTKAAMNSSIIYDKAITAISEPSAKSFGIGSNMRTQLDKARQDPQGFGKMFNAAMRFETDARLIAARPAELSPSIIAPSAETIREAANQIVYGDTTMKDKEFVSALLFEGTLYGDNVLDGKVFSSDDLRARGATDKQISMYYEARASVDASLDETAASVAYNMVSKYLPNIKSEMRDNPSNARALLINSLNEIYDDMQNFNEDNPEANNVKQLIDSVEKVFNHVGALKQAGYMPLSRFGRYSVTAFDDNGAVSEFMRFETDAEAKIKQKELLKQYARVERGVMPTNPSNLFAGADPETVALFVDKISEIDGISINDAVFQEWYRSAVSDRSALKRMLKRKGTAGFDTDLEKVLASFLTSNARFAANNYNRADMLNVLKYLQTDPSYKRKGDVYDEAKQLFDYVQNPADPFTIGRSIMFSWFMGGSIASAAVNMTQPLTMTLPWLYQYVSVTKAAKALKQASSLAGAITFKDKQADGELRKALLRAREIGLVDPQETHHLYKLGSGGIINRLILSKDARTRLTGVATAWGFMFGKAEQYNRYLTFITAWNLAKENNLGNAFEFARRAVEETQGIYSKANRPNWARGTGSLGAVGAAAFTFKQYSIAYVEMLARMAKSGKQGRRAAMLQLGVLFLLAGAMGLPFADDEADILDTMIQFAGGEGNTRRHLREYAFNVLGEDLGMFALYGVTAMMPIDIQGRMGMGNLLPSTALLMPSNSENRGRSALEVFGASGSLVSDGLDAVQGLENGKGFVDVVKQFVPVAVKNVFKGADMLEDGFYADTRGRRVIDTTDADAFWKSLGFQPISVSKAQKQVQGNQQSIARTKQKESAIADLFAKSRFENDPDKAQRAREMLEEWNEAHPDLPIVITPRQVLNRVRAMAMTREERQMRATPRELRATL